MSIQNWTHFWRPSNFENLASQTHQHFSCSFYRPCIGKLFPKIAERHPNRHIQMNFHSASSPTVNFAADTGVDIQSTFFVDWKIQSEPDKQDVNETLAQLRKYLNVLKIGFTNFRHGTTRRR